MFADMYREPRLEDSAREQATTLALGLANAKHRLELIARGPDPPMIRAVQVYRPPMVSAGNVD